MQAVPQKNKDSVPSDQAVNETYASMHLFHLMGRFKPIKMSLFQVTGSLKWSFILVVIFCTETKCQ